MSNEQKPGFQHRVCLISSLWSLYYTRMGSVVHFKGKSQLIARSHVEHCSVKDSRPYLGSEAGSVAG